MPSALSPCIAQRRIDDRGEIDGRAYGGKEKAEKQSLKRLDVRLEFVSVFTLREDDAGEKGSQRPALTDRHRRARGQTKRDCDAEKHRRRQSYDQFCVYPRSL